MGMFSYKETLPMVSERQYRDYTFGLMFPLGPRTLDTLIAIFSKRPRQQLKNLEGRAAPRFTSLAEVGPVAIKYYRRGGWLSRINREKYWRLSKTRSRKELEFLLRVGQAGVPVPEPVAFASRGRFIYRAWLITRAVPAPVSLAQLAVGETEKALGLMPEISRYIRILIKNRIRHVDLHPGNILVDQRGAPCFIDFDKAHYYAGTAAGLAKKYQQRWAKAIRKYHLPAALIPLDLTAIDT